MAIADDHAAVGLVSPPERGLAGRARECRAIDRLLDGGRAGASGVLVIHGDPGAGKSELLRYASTRGSDMRLLHVTAARSESALPFAGLHQLLGPLLDGLHGLPRPQRAALSRAFGLAEGPTDNPLLIVLGALRLLAGAAAPGGLLAIVDDAHWLDDASMAALASVARRLDGEGVVLLVTGRRDLHAADLEDLPRLVLPADDPRRAWDRANAATRPDEALAADLERVADDATARGAHVVASTALERAAGLSPDGWTRARRRLAAAQASWRAGQMEQTLALLDGDDVRDGGEHAASSALLRGACALARGDLHGAVEGSLDAARQAVDPHTTVALLECAAAAASWSGRPDWIAEVRRETVELRSRVASTCRPTLAFVMGSSDILEGRYVAGARSLRAAIAGCARSPGEWSITAATAAIFLGGDEVALAACGEATDAMRERCERGALVHPLGMSGGMELWQGRFRQGIGSLSEALELARETRQEAVEACLLAILAGGEAAIGEDDACRAHAGEALATASRLGLGFVSANAMWSLGRLELARGRPGEALAILAQVHAGGELSHPLVALQSTPDLVEAAARACRCGSVEAPVKRFVAWAQACRSPWGLVMVPAMRGMLGEADPESHYRDAVARSEQRGHSFETARIRLLFGEHLRRARRRLDAREELRQALAVFEAMGATPHAERARAELQAAGEGARRARREEPRSMGRLTPQERQVALHASQGATNKEIAALLFVSRRTVEYHLSNVFDKLGVRSRVELVHAFDALDGSG